MRPFSANAADIETLVAVLQAAAVGELVPYSALSAAIGRDVRRQGYLLATARRDANNASGALFGTVWKMGYKRLAPDEVHTIGGMVRGRIRRSAKRTGHMISQALQTANEMDPEARRKAVSEVTVLGMVAHLTSETATRKHDARETVPPLAMSFEGVLKHLGATPK